MVNLAGTTILSKIDLVTGCHQIPVSAEDIATTAVVTRYGVFEYFQMEIGFRIVDEARFERKRRFKYLAVVFL